MSGIMNRSGQTILLWGTAGPVGRALAARYVESGARLIVLGGSEDRSALPDSVETIDLDPTKPGDLRKLKTAIDAIEGGLQVLAITHQDVRAKPLLEATLEDWQASLGHNLQHVLHVVQAAYPALLAAKGNVVLLGSVGGPWAYNGFGPTGVARASLHTLTRYMACEWVKKGLRVNAVAPGPVVGEEKADALDLARAQSLPGEHDRVGFAQPDAIVDAFDFLSSDRARWITGEIMVVDGGITLGLDFDHFLNLTNYT